MEIKDLTGFGKFFTKVLDVIQQGIGRVFKSTFDKQDIDVEAYRLKKLAEIKRANADVLGQMKYEEGQISFLPKDDNDISDDLLLRSNSRIEFQHLKEQQNIESIIRKAIAVQISEPNITSNVPVEPDWINRFFKIAEEISNDEIQELWARILNGEVNNPGTFSKRSLETLKTMSKKEATIFSKIAKHALITGTDGKSAYLLNVINLDNTLSLINSNYSEFLILVELGLIFNDISAIEFYSENRYTLECSLGDEQFTLVREKNTPINHYSAIQFTAVGGELALLVTQERNQIYHSIFLEKLKSIGFNRQF